MKKSILALLLIPLMIFSGCAARLSYEEYKSTLESADKYYKGIIGMDFVIYAIKDISEIEETDAQLWELYSQTKETLEAFEEINPPKEFEELHKRLLDSMEWEKQQLSLIEECLNAKTQEEFEQARDKITETAKSGLESIGDPDEDDSFGEVYDEIFQKLKDFIPE